LKFELFAEREKRDEEENLRVRERMRNERFFYLYRKRENE
jgi:hypothetical protein